MAVVPTLERGHELRVLDEVIERPGRGRGGIAFVQGAPGIGKTVLLDAVRARAEAAGLQVRSARGSQLDSLLGFGLARRLLGSCTDRSPDTAASADALDLAVITDLWDTVVELVESGGPLVA